MSVRLEQFQLSDLEHLRVVPRYQSVVTEIRRPEHRDRVRMALESDRAVTIWHEHGYPLACVGILPNDVAWAFLAEGLEHRMVLVTRAVQRLLATQNRVLAGIDPSYPQAVRWATILGFRKTSYELDGRERWEYCADTLRSRFDSTRHDSRLSVC